MRSFAFRSGTITSITIATLALSVIASCTADVASSSEAEKLGVTKQAVSTAFAQGSLIIPMGNNHQNNGMIRANGLVYALLRADVPVHWAVTANKAQGAVDFTIANPTVVVNLETNANIARPIDYRGGGFIVAAADRAKALPVITAWLADDNVTVVHDVTAGMFTADIAKTLTAAPSIAVFEDGFEAIAYGNLNAAGILDAAGNTWSLTSPGSLSQTQIAGTAANNADGTLFDAGFPAFAFLSSEHYDTPADAEIVAEVRSWLDAGAYTHAYMQCAAITTFENTAPGGGNPGGRFLTTAGLSNAGARPNPLTNRFPADPIAQFDGNIASDTGTTQVLALANMSTFRPGVRTLINESTSATNVDIMFLTGNLDGDTTNGKVTYLTGHDYATATPVSGNALTNGTRLYYNAIFDSPAALPAHQPAFTVTKAAPALTNQSTVTFTINYTNSGGAPARNVVVSDMVPVGTTFASAANGGTEVAGTVTWNLGVVGPGATGSVSFTVNVAADATITNKARISFLAWQTARTVDSNMTTTIRDATAPDTTIVSGPPATTSSSSATFDFSSTEPNVTYECNLDNAGFVPCTDPSTFNNVGAGTHTLLVRAKDAAGNVDATPASQTWTVSPGTTDGGPTTVDTDGDGLTDDIEKKIGTNPNDADSDDDGVLDGQEPDFDKDTDGDGLINALDPDSDNDGLFDGTELGLGCANPATNAALKHCVPDGDSGATKTNPLKKDTDDGGVSDGSEDKNLNGVIDQGETDPTEGHGADDLTNPNADSDGDGLSDGLEATLGSDPKDADSDDDGVPDGLEANPADDTDGDGKKNILDSDSDGDGLFDGTELGLPCTNPATDVTKGNCVADADNGATKTSMLDADTDRGGVKDGDEDTNHNGRIDPGERDPNNPADDNPGCKLDSDCGYGASGLVCDPSGKCVSGCRGVGGNGCPSGQVCSSTDSTIGTCQPGPAADAGVITPPNLLEGGGCDCASAPGDASTGSTAALTTAVALVITRMRRRKRSASSER